MTDAAVDTVDTAGFQASRLTTMEQVPGLAARALDVIRESILSNQFRPDERLNEVELAEGLGISRAPLREALNRLASEGLVVIIPRRGAFVRSFKAAELTSMYEVREVIEAKAAALAAMRASKQDVNGLRELLDRTNEVLHSGPNMAYPAGKLDLHNRILELSGNPYVQKYGHELHNHVQMARSRSGREPERALHAYDEHCELVDAIAAGDPDTAADTMRRHLRKSLTNVTEVLQAS
jgi:DNA-binding GntR family transcriptional regulator